MAGKVKKGGGASLTPELDVEIDKLEAQLDPELTLDTTFRSVLIIDNLPVVPPEKFEKLFGIIRKICSTFGTLPHEDSLSMPTDPNTKLTLGFALVEYSKNDEADKALEQLNGYKLDKAHIFRVNRWDDFSRFDTIPDTYQPIPAKPYVAKPDLRSWLLDPRALGGGEQFAIRFADESEIYWSNDAGKPAPIYERKDWTESYVKWSPYGNYIATFHSQGIILWGGPQFTKLHRFQHAGVKLIDFSPRENYLVTISSQYATVDNPKDPQCIFVWEISSGKRLRGFVSGGSTAWPAFHWSQDDKYFARATTDVISVYEAPSCSLVENKSVKIPGVKEFIWSPANNWFSYWVPEQGNIPAKVVIMEFPSRLIKRQQNLFNVADCKLAWQNRGDYLCVRVDRQSKTKKGHYNYFEFFRVREKDIPVESLELKDQVQAFEWEPLGSRFALVTATEASGPRPDVQFYDLKGKNLQHLKTLEKKAVTQLNWSPRGGFIVIAGLKAPHNGQLEFFSVNDLETMGIEEHFMCTDVEWDHSGRFVATWVSAWKIQLENGYNLWTFQGKLLRHQLRDRFYTFSWRPRPPSLLPPAKEEELFKVMDKIFADMEAEDRRHIEEITQKWFAEREASRAQWARYESEKRALWEAQLAARRILFRKGKEPPPEEEEFELVEEVTEELVDVREEIVG
jgi:translation initiation factor 3 subunit B